MFSDIAGGVGSYSNIDDILHIDESALIGVLFGFPT